MGRGERLDGGMNVLDFVRLVRMLEVSQPRLINAGADEEYRLGASELLVLGEFLPEPRQTVNEIARLTGIARSNVSRLIANLHRDGWLDTGPTPLDGRVTVISVTECRESQVRERLRAPVETCLRSWVADLGDAKSRELRRGLRELLTILPPADTQFF